MAGERTFVVKFISDTAKATAGFKGLSGGLRGLQKSVGDSIPGFRTLAIAGTAAFAGIAAGLTSAVRAAMEDQKSQVELQRQLEKTFGANEALTQSAERYISATELRLGTVDTELRASLGLLVRATGDLTKSQDLLNLAQDISVATGRDLASVTISLARASQGQFTALSRLGIPLDDATKKSKDFGKVVGLLNDQFGGAAQAAADTFGGQLKILRIQFGEVVETIGKALLPYLERLTKFFVDNVAPAVFRVNTVIGEKGLVAAIQQLMFELGDAGPRIADFFQGVAVAAAQVYNVLSTLFGGIRRVIQALNPFATELSKIDKIDIDTLRKSFDNVFKAIDNYTVRGVPSAIRAQQGLLGSTEDVTEALAGSGAKTVAKSLKTAKEKLDEYSSSLRKAESLQDRLTRAGKSEGKALSSLTDANTNLAEAKARLAQIERGFGAGSPEALAAQKELDKAQRSQERATYAVEEAIYSVADAEMNLAKVRKDPKSSPMDIRRAELSLAEAKLSVTDSIESQIDSTKELNDQQKLLNETVFGATVGSYLYDQALRGVEDATRAQVSAFEAWEEQVKETKNAQDEFNKSLQATADLIAKYPKVLGGMPNPMAGVSGQVPVTAGGGFALRPNDTYQININSAIAEQGLPQLVVQALQQYNRSIGKIPVTTR